MISGSCLCGRVTYEIEGEIGPALHCHCSMCRKVTGAAFRSRVAVPTANFRWTSGEELLTRYQSSLGTAAVAIDKDFYAWLVAQVQAIREQRLDAIDWENVAYLRSVYGWRRPA